MKNPRAEKSWATLADDLEEIQSRDKHRGSSFRDYMEETEGPDWADQIGIAEEEQDLSYLHCDMCGEEVEYEDLDVCVTCHENGVEENEDEA